MLDQIPNAEEMTALVGQSLYDIWNKLCILIVCGTKAAKHGHMNINTAEAVKPFAHYTQEKTAQDL